MVKRIHEGKWLDDLETLLGAGTKTKISSWIVQGLDAGKLRLAFEKASDKGELIRSLESALSIYHQRVYIKDFDNIPGATSSDLVPNGYAKDHVLLNTKVKLANGSFNSDFDITYFADVMSFEKGTAELVLLPKGGKLYRVCNDGDLQFTGGYWTQAKPSGISDVIGGNAVQPEWNSYKNIVEYTVPDGGIWVWKGKSASQNLSNNLNISNPHLAGGAEQVFIPLVYRRIKNSDGSFNFRAINIEFSKNIKQLLDADELWKR